MDYEYNIDLILTECSTPQNGISERDRWPVALDQWLSLYGLTSTALANYLGISRRTIDAWRDRTKSDPVPLALFALRCLEDKLPARAWKPELFRESFGIIKIENNT